MYDFFPTFQLAHLFSFTNFCSQRQIAAHSTAFYKHLIFVRLAFECNASNVCVCVCAFGFTSQLYVCLIAKRQSVGRWTQIIIIIIIYDTV